MVDAVAFNNGIPCPYLSELIREHACKSHILILHPSSIRHKILKTLFI